jgi:hypothetical protein
MLDRLADRRLSLPKKRRLRRSHGALVTAAILVVLPTHADEFVPDNPRSYDCTVAGFFHDDRYPLEDEWAERFGAMSISIIDAGNEVVVHTQVPGDVLESRSIPVTERTVDTVVADSVSHVYYQFAVTLRAPESLDVAGTVTGTLVSRSYETDHTWDLQCRAAIGDEQPQSSLPQ